MLNDEFVLLSARVKIIGMSVEGYNIKNAPNIHHSSFNIYHYISSFVFSNFTVLKKVI